MKKKNEYFLSLYRSRWTTSFGTLRYGSHVWAHAYTGNILGKLPHQTPDEYPVHASAISDTGVAVEFYLMPQMNRRDHRVFVRCPNCEALVPAGRIHQHKC